MITSLRLFLVHLSTVLLLAGLCAANTYGQGGRTGGGGNTGTGGGGGNTGSGGGSNTGGAGGSSGSLFNSGSSSGSLFSSTGSSSTNGGSTGGSSGGSSSMASQTTIQTGEFGSATPITREPPISRTTTGANLINSNFDPIGGQSNGNNNQFANLFSQIGRQMNQGGNFNQQGGRSTARSTIRIPLKLGFAPKPVSLTQFTAKFESRLSNLPGITAISPIRVTMDGSTAVLKGVVASEQDRELAAGVALLEPEVATVRNELTVQGGEAVP
jgi:BON domain